MPSNIMILIIYAIEESYRAISAEIIALIEHPEGQSAADLLGAISALGNLANHRKQKKKTWKHI